MIFKKLFKNLVSFFNSFVLLRYFFKKPSNARNWSPDQTHLASIDFLDETRVRVHNIRNFTYTSPEKYIENHTTDIFSLEDLHSVDYIVEPFAKLGAAHTFLSFGFKSGQYLSISVEIRKKGSETFSPTLGLFRHYELMYVIAREEDIIKLRTNYRKDDVYLYPLQIPKEAMRKLFTAMLKRANKLKEKPEFYNTIFNNCTTNLADHANAITQNVVPKWDLRLYIPENSDKMLYELGLLDTSIPFEELKEKHHINAFAEKYAEASDFSKKIREGRL